MNASVHPPSGLWKPQSLRQHYYGPKSVHSHLLSLLPTPQSKAYIVTGSSLATKTPLIKQVEDLLTPSRHAGTCSAIKQHAPVADVDRAASEVQADLSIDTVISIGGGSPIDSAKYISDRVRKARLNAGKTSNDGYLIHIAIPTTLSAAECTTVAGFTSEDGLKTGLAGGPLLGPSAIIYDPGFARYTPKKLWLATGLRALDHAVELLCHPSATEVPCKAMCLYAAGCLFRDLPIAEASHPDDEEVSTRLFLAAFASLEFLGGNMTAGLGLSHALGYALGSPYSIPHGETSCLTLGHVVRLKALEKPQDAEQLARLLPYIYPQAQRSPVGISQNHQQNVQDALQVGDEILQLVRNLGLHKSLGAYGVSTDQVGVIAERALGGPKGNSKRPEAYDDVVKLVRALFEQTANM